MNWKGLKTPKSSHHYSNHASHAVGLDFFTSHLKSINRWETEFNFCSACVSPEFQCNFGLLHVTSEEITISCHLSDTGKLWSQHSVMPSIQYNTTQHNTKLCDTMLGRESMEDMCMDYMTERSVATSNKGRLTFNSLLYVFILGNLWVERGCIVVFYPVDKA